MLPLLHGPSLPRLTLYILICRRLKWCDETKTTFRIEFQFRILSFHQMADRIEINMFLWSLDEKSNKLHFAKCKIDSSTIMIKQFIRQQSI